MKAIITAAILFALVGCQQKKLPDNEVPATAWVMSNAIPIHDTIRIHDTIYRAKVTRVKYADIVTIGQTGGQTGMIINNR